MEENNNMKTYDLIKQAIPCIEGMAERTSKLFNILADVTKQQKITESNIANMRSCVSDIITDTKVLKPIRENTLLCLYYLLGGCYMTGDISKDVADSRSLV